MAKGPTPREVARAENLERIKRLALEQLAATSAGELSLRAIARELNIVSSAIYRYYPSRDELITDLIIDAYASLADALEVATSNGRRGPRRRWLDACTALRQWAIEQPHRFGLVYGSAIPGYRAPADTIAPAGRVLAALCAPVAAGQAASGRELDHWAVPGRPLGSQLRDVAGQLGLVVSERTMLGIVAAFSSIIGALTLELNGHFVGGFEPADALFRAIVEQEADRLGL
ncbi:TetR/AcrR family transcriptional regulator [Nocardioides sp. AE5]|uniref:TetR/AcrR family transcriptional regulator n=1 Tax=Nocardioides sp. AE5 TaxID=2962573 RepID=UPI00288120D8|nr:TetR/AcrR family transcriptional regulator [Nocardioides sp. AE5]MDT0202119.1 TetR/AcrR family transcriptional regulator [Nocardioides sp. AE5]